MQEKLVAQSILEAALRHAYGRRVMKIHVRLGALREVVASSLSACFARLARDTDCAHAELELEARAGRLTCAECGTTTIVDGPPPRCRDCGGDDVTVIDGAELHVSRIEVESAEIAAVA